MMFKAPSIKIYRFELVGMNFLVHAVSEICRNEKALGILTFHVDERNVNLKFPVTSNQSF